MAQMLATVTSERQDDLNAQLHHVEFVYNNSISAATGLAPNEVHMSRLPLPSLNIFDSSGVAGHQSLARDHLAYCDRVSERQQRANNVLPEMPCFDSFSCETAKLSPCGRFASGFVVGNWAWLCKRLSIFAKGRRPARMPRCSRPSLKSTGRALARPATGPCKIGRRPSSDTPNGSPHGNKLLYWDLPTDMPGAGAHR